MVSTGGMGNSMFNKPFCAALYALALAVVPISSGPISGAWAANEPVEGVDVFIKTQPSSVVIIQVTTNAKGEFTLKRLGVGKYTMQLGGKNIEAVKAAGGEWTVTLQPASREHKSLPPQTYAVRADTKGAVQVDLVVPDGLAITYAGKLTR
jgi:hypothetical protein